MPRRSRSPPSGRRSRRCRRGSPSITGMAVDVVDLRRAPRVRRGRCTVSLHKRAAVVEPEREHLGRGVGHDHDAVADRRARAAEQAGALEEAGVAPHRPAGLAVQRIELIVGGDHQQTALGHGRRGAQRQRQRLAPDLGAAVRVQREHRARAQGREQPAAVVGETAAELGLVPSGRRAGSCHASAPVCGVERADRALGVHREDAAFGDHRARQQLAVPAEPLPMLARQASRRSSPAAR